jgi:four helix bundle protein
MRNKFSRLTLALIPYPLPFTLALTLCPLPFPHPLVPSSLIFFMIFEDLDVWKRSARLSVNIYKELSEQRYWGFRDQITRSGLSIPSNIAEGYERASKAERVRFLAIAKGSAGELLTQTYIGMEAGYINREIGRDWIEEIREISKMLAGLIKHWQSR